MVFVCFPGAEGYVSTSGHKTSYGWKWLAASNNHIPSTASADFWYNIATKSKPGYDCQAMYLYDGQNFGKWVGLPCTNPTTYVCEYNLVPPGQASPPNAAEQYALVKMQQEAPLYLKI